MILGRFFVCVCCGLFIKDVLKAFVDASSFGILPLNPANNEYACFSSCKDFCLSTIYFIAGFKL